MTETHVALEVYEADPDEVTAQLDLEPSETTRKGDKGANGFVAPGNRWVLMSPLGDDAEFDDRIEALLQVILASPGRASTLREFDAVLSVWGYESRHFGFFLSPELLRRISEVGIALDFDFYVLDESDAEGDTV